jgi:hypothetical protein
MHPSCLPHGTLEDKEAALGGAEEAQRLTNRSIPGLATEGHRRGQSSGFRPAT